MPRYILIFFTLLFTGCGAPDSPEVSEGTTPTGANIESRGGGPDSGPRAATGSGAEKSVATPGTATDSASTPSGNSAGRSRQSVTLEVKSWEEVQAMVADARGKIVVVDLWSTACAPCLQEFPHLVTLHNKYKNQDVVCISVSCDYDGLDPLNTYHDMVLETLQEFDATFSNVLLNVPSDEFYPAIDLASIPAVYVYDRDGSVAKRFDNDLNEYGNEGFTYEGQIIPMVEELLAKKQ